MSDYRLTAKTVLKGDDYDGCSACPRFFSLKRSQADQEDATLSALWHAVCGQFLALIRLLRDAI